MKTLITYLYRNLVFMPKLRSLTIEEQYQYLLKHDIDLCNDADILRKILVWSGDYPVGDEPRLRH